MEGEVCCYLKKSSTVRIKLLVPTYTDKTFSIAMTDYDHNEG
jgi:hypothetical protein